MRTLRAAAIACAPRTRRCDNRIETLFVAAREAAIGTKRTFREVRYSVVIGCNADFIGSL